MYHQIEHWDSENRGSEYRGSFFAEAIQKSFILTLKI